MVHPTAKANVKVARGKGAQELGEMLSVRSVSPRTSQRSAPSRPKGFSAAIWSYTRATYATTAGARPDEVDRVVDRLVADHAIRFDRAKEVVDEIRRGWAPDERRHPRTSGHVPEHLRVRRRSPRRRGAVRRPVRDVRGLAGWRSLFLPGGESTTIVRLVRQEAEPMGTARGPVRKGGPRSSPRVPTDSARPRSRAGPGGIRPRSECSTSPSDATITDPSGSRARPR